MPGLKVGLIGCGQIVRLVHLNILTRLPDVELVALAEIDPLRRESAHRMAPAAVCYEDPHKLLEQSDIEAVVICLPNALHAEIAAAALERRKHIYLEKPVATTLGEAERVLSAWQLSGMVGMIGFNYRFNPLYLRAREYIRSGRLGEPIFARTIFSAAHELPEWKKKRESGGGVLLDLASHHIDLIHFLFEQDLCEVFAELQSRRTEDDTAMLQMRLAGGLTVQSFFSFGSIDEDRLEIYGRDSMLRIDRHRSLDVEIGDSSRLGWLKRGIDILFREPRFFYNRIFTPGYEPSFHAALSNFAVSVRAKREVSPSLLDGFRSLQVVLAAEESARCGRVISLQFSALEERREPQRHKDTKIR